MVILTQKTFHDYRKMIDQEKEIDAVVIATPDHTHAVIASYAMNAGKHVYVEKPMTKTIYESRYLRDLAKKNWSSNSSRKSRAIMLKEQ